jgi:hypothetical protein
MALPRTTIAMGLVVAATIGVAIRSEIRIRRALAEGERYFEPQEDVPVEVTPPPLDKQVETAMTELRFALMQPTPGLAILEDVDDVVAQERLDKLAADTQATVDWMPSTDWKPSNDKAGFVLSFTNVDISERVCAQLGPLLEKTWGKPIEYTSGSQTLSSWTASTLVTAAFVQSTSACQLRIMPWFPLDSWISPDFESPVPVMLVGKPVDKLRELLRKREVEVIYDTDDELRWRIVPTLTMYYVPTISAHIEKGKLARLDVSISAPPGTAAELRTVAANLPVTATVEQSTYDPLTYELTIGKVSPLQGTTP